MKRFLTGTGFMFGALAATAQEKVSTTVESIVVATGKVADGANMTTTLKTGSDSVISNIETLWLIAPCSAIFALLVAFLFYKKMMSANEGSDLMKTIAGHVREGAMAYLARQYKVVGIVFAVLFFIFAGLAVAGIENPFVPVAFLTGGFFSGICGYLGMRTATNASSRTAQACTVGLNRGLQVAFRSGAVMGLVVVGFGLLDICLWYLILDKLIFTPENMQAGLYLWGMTIVPEGCSDVEKLVQITTTMITFG
ncbi:MAG: sodium/proton-translocating pyrophosphatase, partial [Victivallales bacterium]|nr:sodium/proton-translocating pyrophosphatase [Victivallales bacterium]